MDFAAAMTNPFLYVTISVGINLFSTFLSEIKQGHGNKRNFEKAINKSMYLASKCVGNYQYRCDIIDDICARLRIVLFDDFKGCKIDEVIIAAIKASLNDFNEENLSNENELTNAFIYFFTNEIEADDNLCKKLDHSYIENTYREVLETKREIKIGFAEFIKALNSFKADLYKQISRTENIDKVYYSSCCEDYLSHLNLFNDDNNVFDNILDALYNKINLSWKEKLVSEISKFRGKNTVLDTKISRLMEELDTPITCKMAYEKVSKILNDLPQKDRGRIQKLLSQCYDKCMIISSEPGAGKTEFLKCVINNFKQRENVYVVPVEYEGLTECKSLEEVEKEVIKQINYYLGTLFLGIKDIYVYSKDIEKIKLIIQIDNFNKIQYKNEKIISWICRLVERYSGINDVFWIFTVNEFDMYIFDGDKNSRFIGSYAISELCFPDKECSLFGYDFNISLYNKKYTVGSKIIEKYKCENVKILYEEDNKIFLEEIYNPLLSHMIGRQGGDIGGIQLKGFYSDFADSIVMFLIGKLKKNNEQVNISQSLIDLVNYLINKSSIKMTKDEISTNSSQKFFDVIRKADLLKFSSKQTIADSSSLYFGMDEEIYELFWDTFWANRVFAISGVSQMDCESQGFLDKISSIFRISEYMEDISAYILHNYDKRGMDKEIGKWLDIMYGNNLLYVALINAKKLSNNSRELLIDALISKDYKLSIRSTYALIYTMKDLPIKIIKKYSIFNKYISSINAYQMNMNFSESFYGITSNQKKHKKMLKNMEMLWTSDGDRLNTVMGSICAHHLMSIFNNDVEAMLNYIISYVNEKKNDLKSMYDLVKGYSKVFWDEFIKEIFYIAIETQGLLEVFNKFNDETTFNWLGKNCIAVMYRINFTRAAGDYLAKFEGIFESSIAKAYKKQYIEVVNMLLNESETGRAIFAFHLITNSLKNDRDEEEKLMPEMQSALSKINTIKGLDDFKKRNNIFFKRIHEE